MMLYKQEKKLWSKQFKTNQNDNRLIHFVQPKKLNTTFKSSKVKEKLLNSQEYLEIYGVSKQIKIIY